MANFTPIAAIRAFIESGSLATARTALGLGSVDDTSDLNKPISTATLAVTDAIEARDWVTVDQASIDANGDPALWPQGVRSTMVVNGSGLSLNYPSNFGVARIDMQHTESTGGEGFISKTYQDRFTAVQHTQYWDNFTWSPWMKMTASTDGVFADPAEFADQVELTGQTAATDDSAMTRALGDVRYASLASNVFTGQQELTGQAATTDDSAMTRALSDARYTPNSIESTGILSGGFVSINAGDDTLIDITAGSAQVVDNSNPVSTVKTTLSWSAFTAEALPDVVGDQFTYVGLESDGLGGATIVFKQQEAFDHDEELDTVVLASCVHVGSVVTSTPNKAIPVYNVHHQLRDLASAIGPINFDDGAVITANGVNLQLDRSVSRAYDFGANRETNPLDPHHITSSADVAFSMGGSYLDGAGGFTFTGLITADVEVDEYDDGSGTLATVPNNNWTVHAVWFFPASGLYILEFGQTTYSNLQAAVDAIPIAQFKHNPILKEGGLLRAWVAVKNGATDLSDTLTNAIVPGSRINP